MLVKMMVTLAVTMVLATGIGTFHIKDMKNIVADSDKQNMLCTIDEASIKSAFENIEDNSKYRNLYHAG